MHNPKATKAAGPPDDVAGSVPPDQDGFAAGSSPTSPGVGVPSHSWPLVPGARVVIGGKDEVFLGRTGNGRYAFVDADGFGRFDGPAPRHRVVSRLGTEIALGFLKPARPGPVDRRGRWTRVG